MQEQVSRSVQLSVIIPCHNAAATLGYQLEALLSQQWHERWEVIAVDNGSTDTTRQVIEAFQKRMPNLRYIYADERHSAAYARNIGVIHAQANNIAFCDADDEVASGWVAAMGEALKTHDFIASRWDTIKLNPASIRGSRKNGQENSLQQYTYPHYLPHAGGCGLGVKRSIHLQHNGFDEDMKLLEDTDYCWRLQLAGHTLTFIPDALIYIRYRENLTGTFRQALGYGEYNVLLYKRYRKHGMPALSLKPGLYAWLHLIEHLRYLSNKQSRSKWIRQLGWRLGRLRGSVRYGVLAL